MSISDSEFSNLRKSLLTRQVVTLCGGFNAELTVDERNAWAEFIYDNVVWENYNINQLDKYLEEGRFELTGAEDAAKKCREVYFEQIKLEKQLYGVAKTWYAALQAGENK